MALIRYIFPLIGSVTMFTSAYAEVTPNTAEACVAIENSADRLACYDQSFRSRATVEVSKPNVVDNEAPLKDQIKTSLNSIYSDQTTKMTPSQSLLDSRWELSEASKLGTWNVRSYKPVYMFPVFWTSKKNDRPHSANPVNTVTENQNLDSAEFKFQLSLKTKAWENIFGNNGDLWLGYTQSSRWQVFNSEESRPFRETNYEPEANLMFRTNYHLLGLDGRMLGVTLNHQSNGRSDPFSRSWNRVMLNIGLERDNFALVLRPWYRIPETAKNDNNPDIENYVGRGDLTAFYRLNDNNFSLMLRHSLKSGSDSHGAVQFDWTFPIKGKLRGQFQYFNGYGESLIDYNHRANYVGLGISLADWF